MIIGQRDESPPGLRLATLDAAGDSDFTLPVEQRDRAHFAEIQPYRIVSFVEALGFEEFIVFIEVPVVGLSS